MDNESRAKTSSDLGFGLFDVITLASFFGVVVKHSEDLSKFTVEFAGKIRTYQETHFGNVFTAFQSFLIENKPAVFGKAPLTSPTSVGFTLSHMKNGITITGDNLLDSISKSSESCRNMEVPSKSFEQLIEDRMSVFRGENYKALHGKYEVAKSEEKVFCKFMKEYGVLFGNHFYVGVVYDFSWLLDEEKFQTLGDAGLDTMEDPQPEVHPSPPVTKESVETVTADEVTEEAKEEVKVQHTLEAKKTLARVSEVVTRYKDQSTLFRMGNGMQAGMSQDARRAAKEFKDRAKALQRKYVSDAWSQVDKLYVKGVYNAVELFDSMIPKLTAFDAHDIPDVIAYSFLKIARVKLRETNVVVK